MGVKLFTLLVDDPEPVFAWLVEHCGNHVVRRQAGQAGSGWWVKIALDDPGSVDAFKARWEHAVATLENHRKMLKQSRLGTQRHHTVAPE